MVGRGDYVWGAFTAGDGMTPTMDFQDSMGDIEQEPGPVDRAVDVQGRFGRLGPV